MWLVLAGVAGAVVVLLAIVLVTPVELELSTVKAAGNPAVRVQMRGRWLGLRFPGRQTDSEPAKTRPRTDRWHASIEWSALKSVITSPGFIRRFVRLVSEELRLTRPRRFYLRARIGFDDPSDTGMFLGWIHALGVRSSAQASVVRVDPDFTGPVVEGEVRVTWIRSLASFVWPLATFGAWCLIHLDPKDLLALMTAATPRKRPRPSSAR